MGNPDRDHQLDLRLGADETPTLVRTTAKQNRARRLPVLQPELVADRGFAPVTGVPVDRAHCPTQRPCPHVRCRWHLMLEDAEHRAGRPGLSSVPRDSKGLTKSQPGDAGDERPGTTLRPGWLRYRGLELERECKAWVHDGELHEMRPGTFDYWLRFVRVGEPVRVFDDDTSAVVALAQVTADGRVQLDRELPEGVVVVVLTRVREVSSCALDEIERHGKLTNEQTGNAVARHRTLIAREVRRALAKAIKTAEGMGMDGEDLMRGLMGIGADR